MTSATAGVRTRPRVLVNIPILNEIENIETLVRGVEVALGGYDYTLLIVDDGSTDGTVEYLAGVTAVPGSRVTLLRRQKAVRGCQRGSALLAGVDWGLRSGNFDVFVEMDGDLSHRTEELPGLVDALARGPADVAIVSKYVAGAVVFGRTWGRTVISRICNTAVRALIRWDILDFSNGYRAFTRQAAASILQHRIRYGSPIYLSEVMGIWLSRGYRVIEVPGTYVGRMEGCSKVRINDYVKAAIGVIEITWRYRVKGFPAAATTGPASVAQVGIGESSAAAALRGRDG